MRRPIPLNVQTLYAGLLQNIGLADVRPGSISKRKIKGIEYLYVTTKEGGTRLQRSLGRADDPGVQAEAEKYRLAERQAKELRTTVSALKLARVPAPSMVLGRVVEAIANAGLFQRGIVLIGTSAYQTYACIVGSYLAGAAIMTEDADLLVASFVANEEPVDLEAILKRADPTFMPKLNQGDRLPKVFEADNRFQVEILTKFGRGRETPILLENLGVSAVALPFMEYLAEESIEAVALYGAGVLVRVPPPLRYAVHKLLIAQERNERALVKKKKDLAQARELIDIALETDNGSLEDTLADARQRGPKWRKNIGASLAEIGREVRQGRLQLAARKK